MHEVINDFLPRKGLVAVNFTSVSPCFNRHAFFQKFFGLLQVFLPPHARCMHRLEPLKNNALGVTSLWPDPPRLRVLTHSAYDPRTKQHRGLSRQHLEIISCLPVKRVSALTH